MGAVVELKAKDDLAVAADEKTERWGRIPIRTAKMAQLGGVALRIFIAISANAVGRSCRTPPLSMTDIADLTGVLRHNIPRAVQQLELAGLIRGETRRDGTVYAILLASGDKASGVLTDENSDAVGVLTGDNRVFSPVSGGVLTGETPIDTEKSQKKIRVRAPFGSNAREGPMLRMICFPTRLRPKSPNQSVGSKRRQRQVPT